MGDDAILTIPMRGSATMSYPLRSFMRPSPSASFCQSPLRPERCDRPRSSASFNSHIRVLRPAGQAVPAPVTSRTTSCRSPAAVLMLSATCNGRRSSTLRLKTNGKRRGHSVGDNDRRAAPLTSHHPSGFSDREQTSPSRLSRTGVPAPYCCAISVGSGSTRCWHPLHQASPERHRGPQ